MLEPELLPEPLEPLDVEVDDDPDPLDDVELSEVDVDVPLSLGLPAVVLLLSAELPRLSVR